MPSIRSHADLEALVADRPRTRKLDVANGGLSSLPPALSRLALHELNLFTNEFTQLPEGIRDLERLRRLSVQSNPLEGLPPWLAELAKLEELQIERCGLSEFRLSHPSLQRLNLSWNPLARLELETPALLELQVANHELAGLDLEGLPRLRKLSATNHVFEVPPDLRCCPELERATLHGAGLTQCPIEGLSRLRSLDLKRNPIQEWPQQGSESLRSLFLAQTGPGVPDFAFACPNLEVLNVASSQLEELDARFEGLGVRFLDLRQNRLEEIPPRIAHMPKLADLHLEHNPIAAWPSFDPPPTLRRLTYYGTPLEEQAPPPAWKRLS